MVDIIITEKVLVEDPSTLTKYREKIIVHYNGNGLYTLDTTPTKVVLSGPGIPEKILTGQVTIRTAEGFILSEHKTKLADNVVLDRLDFLNGIPPNSFRIQYIHGHCFIHVTMSDGSIGSYIVLSDNIDRATVLTNDTLLNDSEISMTFDYNLIGRHFNYDRAVGRMIYENNERCTEGTSFQVVDIYLSSIFYDLAESPEAPEIKSILRIPGRFIAVTQEQFTKGWY